MGVVEKTSGSSGEVGEVRRVGVVVDGAVAGAWVGGVVEKRRRGGWGCDADGAAWMRWTRAGAAVLSGG